MMKNHRSILAVFPLITIFMELLPYGAVLNFGRPATDGTIGYFRETYSYFSLMPFGYANFGPLLTAIFSCLLLVFVAVYIFSGKAAYKKAASVVGFIAIVTSLMPLLLGIKYVSALGMLITASLCFGIALLRIYKE